MFARRATAARVAIRDITEGTLIANAEGNVVGVDTFLGQISRVNLIATVIDRFEATRDQETEQGRGFATITLDDGSGVIRVKMWGNQTEKMANIQLGDLVLVIGKVRTFQGETYINGEVIRRLEDPNWEMVRLLELINIRRNPHVLKEQFGLPQVEGAPTPVDSETVQSQTTLQPGVWQTADTTLRQPPQKPQEGKAEEPIVVSSEVRRKILQIIEEHDAEGGARFEQILETIGAASEEEVEQVLIDLLSEGLVYEPEIHRYKRS
jgi:hypothetical protein